jgi:hypothetical protein
MNTVKQLHTSTATSILTTKSTYRSLRAQRLSERPVQWSVGSIFWKVLRLKIVVTLRVIKWKLEGYLLYEVEVHVRIRRIEAGLSHFLYPLFTDFGCLLHGSNWESTTAHLRVELNVFRKLSGWMVGICGLYEWGGASVGGGLQSVFPDTSGFNARSPHCEK